MIMRLETAPAEACVWMNAGVLSYRLCDRHFDCEHCPLDAALRGAREERQERRVGGVALRRTAGALFPTDRFYTGGHTWLQPLAGRPARLRFGLDGFAASLLARPRTVRWPMAVGILRPEEPFCVIEFDDGSLNLGAPVSAQLSGRNQALDEDPGAVIEAPYGEGWIADLTPIEGSELNEPLSAEAAEARARLDLRRLRRRIALYLLADESDTTPSNAFDGDRLSAAWCLVDGAGYLQFIRELIH